MKIAVYGAGGVGGYFGGRLAHAGADVHLIARGEHLNELRRSGLHVESVPGDFEVAVPATNNPADIGPCDYVLFTVKSLDTAEAAQQLDPLIKEGTAVISLQNGIDNEEKLVDEVGEEHVMGGVAYIFSYIAAPGVIEHTGGPTTITFGELDGSRSDRAERFLEWCGRANIDADLSEEIRAVLWKKAGFICALAGMTAAVRLPIGAVRSTPESWAMFRRLIEEVYAVAATEGVELPAEIVEQGLETAERLEADGYSSLHYDMTHEKPMELEALHGAVVRRGRQNQVAAPMNEAVYAILRPWAQRNQRTQA